MYKPVFFVKAASTDSERNSANSHGLLRHAPLLRTICTYSTVYQTNSGMNTVSLTRLIEKQGMTGKNEKNINCAKQQRQLAPICRQYKMTVASERAAANAKTIEHRNKPKSTDPSTLPSWANAPKNKVSNTG